MPSSPLITGVQPANREPASCRATARPGPSQSPVSPLVCQGTPPGVKLAPPPPCPPRSGAEAVPGQGQDVGRRAVPAEVIVSCFAPFVQPTQLQNRPSSI